MQPERTFYVGSHPCQAYRKTSYNGWAWGLLSMGSLKFRQLESDGANGESLDYELLHLIGVSCGSSGSQPSISGCSTHWCSGELWLSATACCAGVSGCTPGRSTRGTSDSRSHQ